MPRLIASVALTSLLLAGPAYAQQEPVIVSQGEATLTAVADRAFVQVTTEGRAQKPAEAQRLSAVAMTAVQGALKGLGLPADAIRTAGYTLQPDTEYVNGRAVPKGYVARNQIEVKVDDLGRLPDVIDVSGASGAASVSGLRFELKNRTAMERDALRQAVKDAMDRAQAMAAGAGRTVGAIVRIEEQRMSSGPPIRYEAAGGMMAKSVSTPITPGEIEVRAQVTVTVSLAPR
jgi:uncharacterized protein